MYFESKNSNDKGISTEGILEKINDRSYRAKNAIDYDVLELDNSMSMSKRQMITQ